MQAINGIRLEKLLGCKIGNKNRVQFKKSAVFCESLNKNK